VFDFRYHALSLVAVFLALMIGLLLGVAIGDKGLVSSAEHNVRNSLRADVRAAQAQSGKLSSQLDEQKRFQDAVYPLLVQNRLSGQRVVLVALGSLPDGTIPAVRDALQGTGAQFAGVAVVREPVPDSAVEQLANASSPPSQGDFGRLGRAVGAGLLRGGKQGKSLARALLQSSSGNLVGAQGVVVFRAPRDGGSADAANANAFELGMLKGMDGVAGQVVGVESTDTTPSQVRWFRDQRIGSVDDLDQVAGKAALVFALTGANGAWGVKDSAQALLPDAAGAPG
jgi:Copper transport outer membrane protein, MctB